MRKLQILFLIIIVLMAGSCGLPDKEVTVNEGQYVLKVPDDEISILPNINISSNTFTFSYDMLSSYLPVGDYEINQDRLVLTTDDNKYKYVFRIEGKSLFFVKSESSDVSLIDGKCGVQIENDSEFVFNDDNSPAN